jgi:hypothetical protein
VELVGKFSRFVPLGETVVLFTGGINLWSQTSRLGESVSQLSELVEIPFGDEEGLRGRAAVVLKLWRQRGET